MGSPVSSVGLFAKWKPSKNALGKLLQTFHVCGKDVICDTFVIIKKSKLSEFFPMWTQ